MPGNTAYFGFLELCEPKPGETVVVNAAAGAVGSAVCQIALIKGCRVIAFAGSASKVSFLKSIGVTEAHNYKTEDVDSVLTTAAPDGVDCYFDNVGGEFTMAVMKHVNVRARVAVCGAISTYNNTKVDNSGPFNSGILIFKQIRVEGFLVTRWASRFLEGITQMMTWITQGKLKYEETVVEGFQNMPKAFIGLFSGENMGKAVVKNN
uniref:15-oxoprostaglandin 13-reductase n=1 Tax=Hirondellea gigas TaxID=1518452 RepID=A0A6A7FQ91_9CRUS